MYIYILKPVRSTTFLLKIELFTQITINKKMSIHYDVKINNVQRNQVRYQLCQYGKLIMVSTMSRHRDIKKIKTQNVTRHQTGTLTATRQHGVKVVKVPNRSKHEVGKSTKVPHTSSHKMSKCLRYQIEQDIKTSRQFRYQKHQDVMNSTQLKYNALKHQDIEQLSYQIHQDVKASRR